MTCAMLPPMTPQRKSLSLARAGSALVAALLLSAPLCAEAKSFLWRIEGKGKPTSYLLGSIHVGKASFYPLPAAIGRAYAASKVLVLEARPDRAMAALGTAMALGMYTPPDTLQKHISARSWKLVRAKAKTAGLPEMAVERMRPWMLALTFAALDLKKDGFDPQQGIEMHLLKTVGQRPIDVLEGAEWQMKLMAGFPDKQQESFLLYTISQTKLQRAMMKRMVALWKRGDQRGLGKLLTSTVAKERAFKPIYRKLITDRNHSMSKTIDAMLAKRPLPTFFVIGAGHLAGPQNIVDLLKKRGYRLTQL